MGDALSEEQVHQEQLNDTDGSQLDVLGGRVKKLVRLIEDLEQLGIGKQVTPLPKIIVVGDQSAGKSSLIEGISGIRVPRSSGTCTRCPLQITLLSSEDTTVPWSCTITLDKKFSFDPVADGTQGRYGKWREDLQEGKIFATVTDKSELENVLRRAQWATLNPAEHHSKYIEAQNVDQLPLQVGFSPNAIILDITAPNQPNLSFIDLPGIIRQTEATKDKWMIKLVENLVMDYIVQDNSLILLARSMESDFANSSATALIESCNALGRTVGCLTKPDRFPEDDPLDSLERVLGNQTFEVGHGYFVCKQPSQKLLDEGISSDDARSREDEFFSSAPWTTKFQPYHDRFGTIKLRDSLSVMLTQQIIDSLPTITAKINDHLTAVVTELSGYPDPPANAQGQVLEALNAFASSVEKNVDGVHPYNEFRNSFKTLASVFHKGLIKLRPGLVTVTPKSNVIVSLLSDDEADRGETPCPVMEPTPQSRKRKNNITTPSTAKKVKVDRGTPTIPIDKRGKKSFKLDEIRAALCELTVSDVPNEVDPRAVDHLRQQTVEAWDKPTVQFLDSVKDRIRETLQQLLEEACVQWLATDFFKEACDIVFRYATKLMLEQTRHAQRALKLEQSKPFTLNEQGFEFHRDKELKVLREGRDHQRALEKLDAGDRVLDKTERNKKADDPKVRADLGEDPFEQEIKVMASVRGYHDVALLRFLDHVVHGVLVEVLGSLKTELPSHLKSELGVEATDAYEHCTQLLADNPERERRRVGLQKERKNLEEALNKLSQLEASV